MRIKSSVLLRIATLVLGALALLPSAVAQANNVGDALVPSLGGGAALAVPADGHLVYRVHAQSGDWIIGYQWARASRDATGELRVMSPVASDVASSAVATSTEAGILFWQAPVEGWYYCDFSCTPGAQLTAGLFLSHARISLLGARTVVVPYGGSAVLSCELVDSRYTYTPFDGPTVPFESLMLSSSADGVSWRPYWAGMTDVNGRLSRTVTKVTRRQRFSFSYDGALYDTAGLAPVISAPVTVVPRFGFTVKSPRSARRGVGFSVYGTAQPKFAPGPTDVLVQARKKGSGATLNFSAAAYPSRSGASPLRGIVKLPSGGVYYVRLYHATTTLNAETATKWVRVDVR